MRHIAYLRSASAILLFALISYPAIAEAQTSSPTPPQRDPQALALLQNSVKAMGDTVPSDSVATGSIETVAGTETSQGNVRILTKGSAQTLVEESTTDETRTLIFSNGQANEVAGAAVSVLPLELVVTSQAPEFPLPLVAALLNDPDMSFRYVGIENSNGISLQHIQAWKSFTSQPDLQALCSFSMRDIWIDSASGLPERISYVNRPAQGAVAGLQVDVYFSNYQKSGTVLYPFSLQESQNGTPWATITIQNVSFNTGLSDSSFPIE